MTFNARHSGTMLEDSQVALVRNYIDTTLMNLLHELSLSPSEGQPSITLRTRPTVRDCSINSTNGTLEARSQQGSNRTNVWPGRTSFEAWKFTVIIRVLAVIDEALRTGQKISKRDIFYIDPAYFQSQRTVDAVIDDIAFTIGVDRGALHVEAAAKGLVAGQFRLKRESQVVLDARYTSPDTLIPRLQDDDDIDISGARWVLVVEKEAVFHRLARNDFHTNAIAGNGILVTGKGYPDLCTREFLRRLFDVSSTSNHRPPRFYALVDGDPDGIAIMSTYKHGSLAHLHDNARLVIPALHWLGLRVSDAVMRAEVATDVTLLGLTVRDRRKIVTMLRNNPVYANDGPEVEWRVELQRMLMLNVKTEIEVLYEHDGGLEAWIDRKMFRQA
ncbi:uncharacterized protein N7459_008280 [Penicillium hispanicum]|uniref:uncharacterized protein n=1 Tax=Penicillium hispanicum TaxID=1080232 RepID=UPI002540E21B|nr:uncharacterized protein N7459_008280 [Penicillium hispanicum]KAJ5573853.1 hypothetical protein N7459_008280 [Penicillium hispanicum]